VTCFPASPITPSLPQLIKEAFLNNRIVSPRRRLVNFRVTEEEHRQIRQACLARGSRGVSEFARSAVLESAHILELPASTPEPRILAPQVSWFEERIASFDCSLNRLVDSLDALTAHLPALQKE
jgi:hypothetical protein